MNSKITTVLGNLSSNNLGIVDSHNHIWIDPVVGVSVPNPPVLNQYEKILSELKSYKQAGGDAIVDCQPGGCGRNGKELAKLSKSSGVTIIASTGFHRPIYYSPDYWLLHGSSDQIADYFIEELTLGLKETSDSETPIKAGFIKIACEESVNKTYQPGLLASAQASIQTGRIIEIHTEKGLHAAEILDFFIKLGVAPHQIVICHMDKHPDIGLHQELARTGASLEYDTFYRIKYRPEEHLWILITRMLNAGFEDHICLATDMAESMYWKTMGEGPGLDYFPRQIRKRLIEMEFPDHAVEKIMGANISRLLANIC
jgi:phosphotriesterase-related protein